MSQMKKTTPYLQISIISFSLMIFVFGILFLFKAGIDFSQTNILSDHISSFEKVTTPINYESRVSKGDGLMGGGFYNLAASEYAFAISIQPENPDGYAKLGRAYLALQDSEKAVLQFQQALEIAPDSTEYKALMGKAMIANGQFQDAQGIFDGFSKEIQEAQYYGALLDGYYGRFEDAKKKLEKAITLAGSIPVSDIERHLSVYNNFEKMQDAQKIYLQALLAEALNDTYEYELAEAVALEVLGVKSDYRDVWILLGYAQMKSENYNEAEESFNQAKKLDAIKPETHYFLASTHFFEEEYDEAVNEYELALLYGFKPEIEAYKKIAECNLLLEKYDDALAAYEHIIKIDSSNVDIFVKPIWIAISYLGDLDRALSLAQNAQSRFPDNAMSHNLLAWVYIERNELDKAETELGVALSLDPGLAEAHYNAGRMHEAKGNIDQARSEYKKAYESAEPEDSIGTAAAEKYNSLILETIE